MAAEKLSVSLESETVARARRAAERDGVPLSRWLDRAARKAADLDEARLVLEEHFAEHGQPSQEARSDARSELEEAGVGRPVPLDEVKAAEEALAYLDRVNGDDEG